MMTVKPVEELNQPQMVEWYWCAYRGIESNSKWWNDDVIHVEELNRLYRYELKFIEKLNQQFLLEETKLN